MKRSFTILTLVLLLLCAGTIYASSNSDQNLSQWYEKVFESKSTQVGKEAAAGLMKLIQQSNSFLAKTKVNSANALAIFQADTTLGFITNIQQQKSDYVTDIKAAKEQLHNENLREYIENRNIEADIEQDVEKIMEEVFNN